MHRLPIPSPLVRALGAALLATCMPAACAAEWLFVGTYYVRADKDRCAEGAYVMRDARSESELKAIAAAFMANPDYKDKRIERYKRGKVVALYRAQSKDVNYMGRGSCTYTRFNSLSVRNAADLEQQVMQRRIDYPSSFLSDPVIVHVWQGEDLMAR